MLEFNKKYKEYEVRVVNHHLMLPSDDEEELTIELIKWDYSRKCGKYCITLAYFEKGVEGYTIRLVGNRYFSIAENDIIEVHKMLEEAYNVLNKENDEDNG